MWSFRRGSRKIEHIGSAYDDGELEALKAAARQRLAAGQTSVGRACRRRAPRTPALEYRIPTEKLAGPNASIIVGLSDVAEFPHDSPSCASGLDPPSTRP